MKPVELTFKCKLITPMFMAGADRKTPELRPSEFKGMMRFWWRAIKAEDDIKKLKKEESQIFGGTEEKEGRSKIWIRIKYKDLSSFLAKDTTVQEEYKLNWYFDKSTRILKGKDAGIGYLWYSTYLKDNERGFIKPPFEFKIRLIINDKNNNNKKFLRIGSAVLWTAIYLGGFGTRIRRGAGNLEIVEYNITDEDLPNFECQAKNKKELKDFLEKNLFKIKEICEQAKGTDKYFNLRNAKIIILDPHESWISALNFLGNIYQEFRNKHKNQIFEIASFGMPIIHTNLKLRMVPYQKIKNNFNRLSERLASPIIFKLIKSKNFYFPLIIKLSGGDIKYIGAEEKRGKEWELKELQDFCEDLIWEFLKTFKNKEEILL